MPGEKVEPEATAEPQSMQRRLPQGKAAFCLESDMFIKEATNGGSTWRDIPVEWDVLGAAVERCLQNTPAGFVECRLLHRAAHSMVFRLSHKELGDLGLLEIYRLRAGESDLRLMGIYGGAFTDAQRELLERHVKHLRSLSQGLRAQLQEEGILPQDAPGEDAP